MKAGDRILDYFVERMLGEGGMGTVYHARHTVLDQEVAIKILDPEVARKPGVKERFIQEANIQAKLRHPHIVQVLTATHINESIPALIMDYVDGKSLSEVLELRGALPVDDALKIMEQVLSAVGYAHRQGVIHRDLKPSNVMVMASGEVRVTDFGIAKVLGSSKLTRTGTAMGSAHYMSPEQIRRPEAVDARSDIYSLGCVFYELLTGRPPFGEKDASGTESDFEIKSAHVNDAAPAIKTVKNDAPEWLAELVMNMLEKQPDNRPSNCELIWKHVTAGDQADKPSLHVRDEHGTKDIYGGKYEGMLKDGKANGFGKWTSDDGDLYAGEFKDDEFHGNGTFYDLANDEVQGRVYAGEWENDQKNGQGTMTWPDGREYVGEWEDNSRTGHGTFTWPDGDKYAGEFDDGQFNGTGTYTWPDGREYVGEWAGHQQNGQGTMTWPDGRKYVGEWKDDKRNGHGTLTWLNGDKYVGEWKDNKRNGHGTLTWPDGTKYAGEWKDGDRNGQGTFTWIDGDKYVGDWKGDKKTGRGALIYADGRKIVGEFREGCLHGAAIKYRADGSVAESGIYERDKLKKQPLSKQRIRLFLLAIIVFSLAIWFFYSKKHKNSEQQAADPISIHALGKPRFIDTKNS
jgi:serine/threonine protein kinase